MKFPEHARARATDVVIVSWCRLLASRDKGGKRRIESKVDVAGKRGAEGESSNYVPPRGPYRNRLSRHCTRGAE